MYLCTWTMPKVKKTSAASVIPHILTKKTLCPKIYVNYGILNLKNKSRHLNYYYYFMTRMPPPPRDKKAVLKSAWEYFCIPGCIDAHGENLADYGLGHHSSQLHTPT